MSYVKSLYASHTIGFPGRYFRSINGNSRSRYALLHTSTPISDKAAYFASRLALQPIRAAPSHSTNPVSTGPIDDKAGTGHGASRKPTNVFERAIMALQERDARKLLIRLQLMERMSEEDLQQAAAQVPRTTFIEFFRALDPLRVARDCDSLEPYSVPVGMFKLLQMDSTIDEWGVRRLYTRLFRRLMLLMRILQTFGYRLHVDEYISLIRCAGAISDIAGVKWLWYNMKRGAPRFPYSSPETYLEFVKARFLVDPLYTNYQKTIRMVTPRNLHRSKLKLSQRNVQKLDFLRLALRKSRLRFGLNKHAKQAEDLTRMLRGSRPAHKLFWTVKHRLKFFMDEETLCAFLVGLGRAGALRMLGTDILQNHFGIKSPHKYSYKRLKLKYVTRYRIQPTVRLMRAIVEVYGSNSEISTALRLVELLSTKYSIPIPPDVWHDLLEWTYIMSVPPASTAWKNSNMLSKIPSPKAVEMIWNAMVSPPYNHVPNFHQYNILIRSLIGRRLFDIKRVLPHMRYAIALYHDQCREYEAAVFEYTQHMRDGVIFRPVIHRFEKARVKKEQMWYHISEWCHRLLKEIRYSHAKPLPSSFIPDFIDEFRQFLRNPITYATPWGRVSLVDPNVETFVTMRTNYIRDTVPMKGQKLGAARGLAVQPVYAVLSSHSLAKIKPSLAANPLNLLLPHKQTVQQHFHKTVSLY
ncbi:mitochondrial ATPase expression-domain-containing protein [Xylaria nigripes]|nr:mitochondrial ATPase expression-domain-containing protein [Xylaria nigripes]